MPRPKGWSASETKRRDRIARRMRREHKAYNPWAVATAVVKKQRHAQKKAEGR